MTKDGEKYKQLRAQIAIRRKNVSTKKGNRSERVTVKYYRRRRRSKEDWMDGSHYVKRFVRLINL